MGKRSRELVCCVVLGVVCWLVPAARALEASFSSNGVPIHYSVDGEGEPVLLIHGLTLNHQLQWGLPGTIKRLARDYRVIAFDTRGHGLSGKPRDPGQYGLEMVRDAIRLLDHLKIHKVHVVGYSMGGFIAQKLITLYPERVLSATVGGAGWSRQVDPTVLEGLAADLEQGKGIGRLIRYLTPPGRPKPTDEQLRTVNMLFGLINDPKALAAAVRAMRELDVPEEALKTCRVPTQAVIGELDPFCDGVYELQKRLPGLRTVIIKGADHMDAPSRPEFLRSVEEFLAQQAHGKTAPAHPD